MGVTGLRVDCVCVFVGTQNVYVQMCLYICVSYMRGRIRRGSEREDGASMRGWREFGLDSAGKGKSYRLSGGMLTGYPAPPSLPVLSAHTDLPKTHVWISS